MRLGLKGYEGFENHLGDTPLLPVRVWLYEMRFTLARSRGWSSVVMTRVRAGSHTPGIAVGAYSVHLDASKTGAKICVLHNSYVAHPLL